jgi:peptidoglycan/LPS O-acetylase OafA/YrhL
MPMTEGGLESPIGRTSRLRGVDGVRALAVLAVVTYHNWLYTAPRPEDLGYVSRFVLPHLRFGLTLFFILSGFLLYRPLVARVLEGSRLPSIRRYYRSRALRILPGYWAILFVVGVILPATVIHTATGDAALGRLAEQPTVLLRNALLVQNYFADSMDTGILPAWTLAVSAVFYLVLPFLGILAAVVAARAFGGRWRAVATLAPVGLLFAAGTVVVPPVTVAAGESTLAAVLGRSFLNHADLFAFGMALAVVMVSIEQGRIRAPSRWWRGPAYGLVLGLAGVTMLLADRGVIDVYRGAVPYELLTGSAAVLLLALVVVPVRDGSAALVTRILDTQGFVALGLVSFSLFLWHEPLMRLAFEQGLTLPGAWGFWGNLLILGAIAVALSVVTYRFVEQPALARKRSGTRATGQTASRSIGAAAGGRNRRSHPRP